MSARLVQVILTDDQVRGKGIVGDPIRRLISVYTPDGRLIAQVDPLEGDAMLSNQASDYLRRDNP